MGDTNLAKLDHFKIAHEILEVKFIETQQVKEGVGCDTYSFVNDNSRDLAIVRVKAGHKTPLQKILKGTRTIEGFLEGAAVLTVRSEDGNIKSYTFKSSDSPKEIEVNVGQVMQWVAAPDTGLTFYEICYPPYKDGRFENLPE